MAPGNGGFRIRGKECWNRKSRAGRLRSASGRRNRSRRRRTRRRNGKATGWRSNRGIADHAVPAPHTGDGPGMAGGMAQVTHKAGEGAPASHRSGVMEMKALSVRQPFASQIVIGEKDHRMEVKTVQLARPSGHLCLEKRDHRTGQRETSARRRGPRHCGCGGMPPHDAGRPCCGVLRGL